MSNQGMGYVKMSRHFLYFLRVPKHHKKNREIWTWVLQTCEIDIEGFRSILVKAMLPVLFGRNKSQIASRMGTSISIDFSFAFLMIFNLGLLQLWAQRENRQYELSMFFGIY